MEQNTFFLALQRLSQLEDSGVEVFIDQDGEIEFEIDVEVFLNAVRNYEYENK
jgi:hypothetical protein